MQSVSQFESIESTYIDYGHTTNGLCLSWTLLSRPVRERFSEPTVSDSGDVNCEHTCSSLDLSSPFGKNENVQRAFEGEMQHSNTCEGLDLTYPLLGKPPIQSVFERERKIFEMPMKKAA